MCVCMSFCVFMCVSWLNAEKIDFFFFYLTSYNDNFFFLLYIHCVVAVQSLSGFQLFVTPWTALRKDSLSFTISQSLLKLISIESLMPSNHLILCHPLHLMPLIFPRTQ